MSRSPAIVAAALSLVRQARLDDCLTTVCKCHATDISPGLLSDVVRTLNRMLVETENQ